ncbi:MAG: ABC transporter ATP-binding protein/permease [Eubacteriales bacterium]|nr:ABC transporter ATP-binding protein/permease [Eubacteriales bacterium]
MLELKNIVKDYPAGQGTVHALKGISLRFRSSEFVSILGQSGCGKTTMLNILGGLDQYTSGDLVIGGISTKNFKDRDWDTYRNHSVGFIFQSYHLIPHQSVLQNVELALTLSGVSRAERRQRARRALEQVGLGSQMKKKPGEMSGGQMQRVAIARAIVNDPDIILADEPTGALDSETSLQVMDILKEISQDRLVVMVTHNPELADRYSTRIVRMKDGQVTGDSRPVSQEEWQAETERRREKESLSRAKKPSMSFATSFGLSLKNLMAKKGRTLLTSVAGSIGIIGIALIYAVSQGTTAYIDMVQENTLTSYPLMLESHHTDLTALMESFITAAEGSGDHEKDAVYQKPAMYNMVNTVNNMETQENDLRSFKEYLEKEREDEESSLAQAVSGVSYTYDMELPIYTKSVDGTIIHSDLQEMVWSVMAKCMGSDMKEMGLSREAASGQGGMMAMMGPGGGFSMWQEMLSGDDGRLVSPLLEKQYDLVYGSWPDEYDEIVLVLDENQELDDMTLYALGLKSQEEMDEIADAAVNGKTLEVKEHKWSYEEVCGMEFRTVLSADCYVRDETTGLYGDLRDTEAGLKYLYDNGTRLRVSGIIRPKEDALSTMLTGSIGYTSALTRRMVEKSGDSQAIASQLADPETDIFTGLPFQESKGQLSQKEKAEEFRAYMNGLDAGRKGEAYIKIMSIPSQEEVDQALGQSMGGMTREEMEKTIAQGIQEQTSMGEEEIRRYVEEMEQEELSDIFRQLAEGQFQAQYAKKVSEQLKGMAPEELAAALDAAMEGYTSQQCAGYYDQVLEFSDSSYEENLRKLGYVDLEDPSSINLYASAFADKDVIQEAIAVYNEGRDELSQIQYTDYVGLMMSSVTTIINAITYVLMAFVAVSLIVSSIMIGVITLISVQERTKEIGILRAIGASKRNVSSMFNAETLIIGFSSGLFGVLVTWLLCIPINLVLHHLTGIQALSALLPLPAAVVLVAISMTLTLIAGIIPSRSAAKKDPVVALRTE